MNWNIMKMIRGKMKLFYINMLTTIALANSGFVEHQSVAKWKITKVLATTSEPSLLQCLHRCKFINNDAKAQFENGQCKCLQFDEGKTGSLTDLFSTKRIELKPVEPVKPGDKKEEIPTPPPNAVRPFNRWQRSSCEQSTRKRETEKRYEACINVALKKPSSQPGTYYNRNHNKSPSGNDGNYKTVSIAQYHTHPYWTVDLQKTFDIKLIRLFLSNGTWGNSPYPNLRILTREKKSENWVVCKRIGTPGSLQLNVVCDEKNTQARYVRVDAKNTAGDRFLLEFYEVEVYTW